MAEIQITAEKHMEAPAERVYRCIANYHEHHPRFLPPAFSDFRVEAGGIGAGTIISYKLAAGGRTQAARHRVAEPEPGRVLTESDGRLVTTFTVTPEGEGSHVRIDTAWRTGGIRGLFERVLAPRVLNKTYADELERLNRYALALPEKQAQAQP